MSVTMIVSYYVLDVILLLSALVAMVSLVYISRRLYDLRAEVDRRIHAEFEANKIARHDSLTGLPNKRGFLEHIKQTLQNEHRNLGSTIIVIDLDHFKPVNDLYGHRVGDAVLCEAARRLKRALDGHGFLARLGTDKFGVMIAHLQNRNLAERIARRMVHDTTETIYAESLAINLSASIGITLIDSKNSENCSDPDEIADKSIEQAFRRAYMALRKAKNDGGKCFRFFEKDMDEKLQLHIQLEAELAEAIKNKEIVPYYQQLVDLATKKIIGFEILARWRHPSHGLLSPNLFIPIAEDIGLIAQMTVSILEQAIKDAAEWPDDLLLTLNLSPHQLASKHLTNELLDILRKSNFPPHRLEIEISEKGILDRIDDVNGVLASLRSTGIQIALDNYGTGYSGLYQLRDLKIDTIKIDRSFVTNMLKKPEEGKIVEAVIKLGEAMGIPTIAGGVETPDVVSRLLELGCSLGQGFYFGKPQPGDTINQIVRSPHAERTGT